MDDFKAEISYVEVQNVVGILQHRGEDLPHDILGAVGEAMVTQVLDVFETEGFGEWPELADSTLERRMHGPRGSSNPKILQDTGLLVGSITYEVVEDQALAFTNVPYGIYHTSRAPRTKLPLRDFLAIDEAFFERDVIDMIDTYMMRALPRAAE